MRFASFGFARARWALFAWAAASLAFAPSVRAASSTIDDADRLVDVLRGVPLAASLRLVESPAGVEASEAEARLSKAGYDVAVAVPPRVYVVRMTKRAGALPAGFLVRGDGLTSNSAANGARATTMSGGTPTSAGTASTVDSDSDPFHGLADALPPLLAKGSSAGARSPLPSGASPPLPAGLFYGTRSDDLSEFMLGRVGIGIYFPESDGSVDPDLYDWTPALRDSVIRSAVRGFLGWSDFAATQGIPLSFFLEVHPSLPTRYEPISRPVSQEELWIEDMLRPIVGYRGDALLMATEEANNVRARLGTHWAGLVIAVQNDTSSTGTFPDGLISHARLGGPWFVTPVNNLKSQSASLDFYMRHEVTHLFWALDEFPANNAWWSCTLTTGYFNRPNWNSDIPFPGYCEPHVDCLMRGNFPNALCHRTMEQVGWVDADRSGLLDFYETRPLVAPDSARYRLSAGNPLILHGRAGETALPNVNPYRSFAGDSISVSVIDSILYRVDAGPWISIPCVDGVFDEGDESFNLVLPPLSIGNHTIEWQAWNSNGRQAAINATTAVTVSGSTGAVDPPGSGGAGALRLAVGPSPGRGPIRFALIGSSASPAVVRLWTPTGTLARAWRLPAGATNAWAWDGRLKSGERAPSGVYFVTVDAGPERLTRRLVYLR
jgi:hypothetical protein